MDLGRILLASFLLLLATIVPGAALAPSSPPAPENRAGMPRRYPRPVANHLETPHNVILFLGDGMGPEHVRAAHMFLGRSLVFESFPYTTTMTTESVAGVTDSAAAATAMATGRRVNNGVVSVAIPGNGEDLTTTLERWQVVGSPSGLVTTSYINDASPAAFAAHEPSRANLDEIADEYFEHTRPNVLMGGAGDGVTEAVAEAAGYTVVANAVEMLGLDASSVTHVSGQFGRHEMPPLNHGREPLPSLAQMTETGLDLLGDSLNGFFLMVEQEGTDSYSHGNNAELMVDAVIELEAAVEVALAWAGDHDDTLIIVTADHETGGLEIQRDNGPGELPDVEWTAGSRHTATPVPIYASGPGAGGVMAVEEITELHAILGPADVYSLYVPVALDAP